MPLPPSPSLADDLRGAMHAYLATQRPRDKAERDALMAAWKAGAAAALAEVRGRLAAAPANGQQ